MGSTRGSRCGRKPVTLAPTLAHRVYPAARPVRLRIVGDSLNGFTDAIRRKGGIDWPHVRHEETAAFAAAGEAHVTGELAVCAGSCDPDNLHLINALFDAHRSNLPVVGIAAHIPSAKIGSGYFQETHPEQRAAVDVPTPPRASLLPAPPAIVAPASAITQLAALLNEAKRITLLCGGGVAGAHAEVVALARQLQAPIVHALRGKEHVEWDNPYDVGMTGLIGFASGYHAMASCDALLMLGTDFPDRQFYPGKARIAQIDIRARNIGKRARVELGVVGDVGHAVALPMMVSDR